MYERADGFPNKNLVQLVFFSQIQKLHWFFYTYESIIWKDMNISAIDEVKIPVQDELIKVEVFSEGHPNLKKSPF